MTSSFEMPLDESVQILKRVLPLMSQQRVPTIPQNYAIWYDYVMKDNDELSGLLDKMIQDDADFNPAVCRRIYEKYFLERITAEVDGIQGAIRTAVESVINELAELGEDFDHFAHVLDDCSDVLDENPTPEDLQKLIVDLAKETAQAKNRSLEVESSFKDMATELDQLRVQVERLTRDSRTDPLTGVANRRAFDEAMQRIMAESAEDGTPMCLIMCDIDHFKSFNDTHGHLVGDAVLRFIAREMEQCVKGRDLLARYGGEEFAVVLPSTPISGAMMLAESIRAIIEAQKPQDDDGNEVGKVTISLGVAQYVPGEDINGFIDRADACLYASKSAGRNCVTSEQQLPKQ